MKPKLTPLAKKIIAFAGTAGILPVLRYSANDHDHVRAG